MHGEHLVNEVNEVNVVNEVSEIILDSLLDHVGVIV